VKILLTVHQYLPRQRAGTEVFTHSLAKRLAERHEVLVYTHEATLDNSDWPGVTEEYDGVRVRRVAAWLGQHRVPPWQVFRYSYSNPLIEADFAKTLREFAPDMVHVQHLKDLSVGILEQTAQAGIPLLMTLHDYWALCPNAQFIRPDASICAGTHARLECGWCAAERLHAPWLRLAAPAMIPLFAVRDRAIRRQMAYVQRFIAPSEFLRQQYIRAGYPPEKIQHVENGIDLDRLKAAAQAPRGPLRGHYAYLGSIAWQKGVHVLVEAFRRLGDVGAELRIWGKLTAFPDYAAQLQEAARDCPWIKLEGELDHNQVSEALTWADYLVVPSVWWENAPSTIVEAYAAHVPVIVSRLGALTERVQEGETGFLFAPGDAEDLLRVIQHTLREPGLLEHLRTALPPVKSAEEYTREMEAIYYELRQGN